MTIHSMEMGISTRVTAGLAVIVFSMLLASALIAITFGHASQSVSGIILRDLPSLMSTFNLVRQSEYMEASTPDVLAAQNQFIRESLTEDFKAATIQWEEQVASLQKQHGYPPEMDKLVSQSRNLHKNLQGISDIINKRMTVADQIVQTVRRVRRLGERLNNDTIMPKESGVSDPQQDIIRTLNLCVILLLAVGVAEEPGEVARLELRYRQRHEAAVGLLNAMPDSIQKKYITIHEELTRFAFADDSLFFLAEKHLGIGKQLEDRLVSNRFLSSGIVDSTDTILNTIKKRIEMEAAKLTNQLSMANYLAIILPVICFICAMLIIAYLRRSVITRILSLQKAMVDHMQGGNAAIVVSGNDEISAMAKATSYFIDEINNREERLLRSHEELELRVQKRTRKINRQNDLLRREIRDRKEVEAALRESEGRFRLLAENLREALCLVEMDTNTISYANRSFYNMFGARAQAFLQNPFLLLEHIHPEDRPHILQQIHTQWGTDLIEQSAAEYRVILPDGSTRYMFSRVIVIHDNSGCILRSAVMVEDITRRKNNERIIRDSEARLKYLSTKLLEAQEEERRRLAAELHDNIGPSLGTVKFGVENVHYSLQAEQQAQRDMLKTVIDIVKNIAGHIGRIQMELRPSMIDDLGIIEAIDWYCQEYMRIYCHITVKQHIRTTEECIPAPLVMAMYRIVQEALNNIAKHSGADTILLTIESDERSLRLVIEDNGSGFDPESITAKRRAGSGLGLVSMQERVELSAGSFDIITAPSEGVRIICEWDPTYHAFEA